MPKIGLDRAEVPAVVGELVAGRVPEHVGMALERKPGLGAGTLDQLIEAIDGEGVRGFVAVPY